MVRSWIVMVLCFATSALAVDYSAAGPEKVVTQAVKWVDAARKDREVPARIYMPEKIEGKAPLIIFSHGLGGSADGYGYLANHFASHGYICVHVQHHGSDTPILMEGLRAGVPLQTVLNKAAVNPENLMNRPADVSFAIDEMTKLNESDPVLKGKIDLDDIAVAGHSFGGYTTMAIAGQTFVGGKTFGDKRVKAAIAMSPPAPRVVPENYQSITIPVMVMTGTLDDSPILASGKADQRVRVYEALTHAPRYLLVFDGGDHIVFSGRREAFGPMRAAMHSGGANDAKFQADIKALCVAFFDANLKHDQQAKAWLDSDAGAKAMLGKDAAQWEHAEAR